MSRLPFFQFGGFPPLELNKPNTGVGIRPLRREFLLVVARLGMAWRGEAVVLWLRYVTEELVSSIMPKRKVFFVELARR